MLNVQMMQIVKIIINVDNQLKLVYNVSKILIVQLQNPNVIKIIFVWNVYKIHIVLYTPNQFVRFHLVLVKVSIAHQIQIVNLTPDYRNAVKIFVVIVLQMMIAN